MIKVVAKELDTVATFSSYSRAYAFKRLLETKGISAKVRANKEIKAGTLDKKE